MATKRQSKKSEPVMFIWEGLNRNGVKIKGETMSLNANLLRAELRRDGINTKYVRKKPKALGQKPIKPLDIAQFARQLTTMMRSGVPLVQGLELIGSGHEKPTMQSLIKQIRLDVESGETLANTLAKHPKYFDKLFVSLIDAGEQSGNLEGMLDKIATYKEKSETLKGKVKKALMYPVMVIIAAIVVSVIMLIWVIPSFKEVFENFGAELPAFTQMVIDLSEWLQAKWWQPLLGMIVIGTAFTQAKRRSPKFNRFLDKAFLKFPIIGGIVNMSSVARFSRTLATMFASGVPLVEAMDSVAGSTGNAVYEDATYKMKHDTSRGVQLNVAMQTTQVFPNMVVQMTKIGEESGKLEEMLAKVADYYEEQVDNLVDTLSKQLEPLIMAVLGILVGGLVVAMYLPIFKLGAVV